MRVAGDACGGLNAQRPTPNAQLPKQAALRVSISAILHSSFFILHSVPGRWALNAPRLPHAFDAIALGATGDAQHRDIRDPSCPFVVSKKRLRVIFPQRGAALLIALWAILVLTTVVLLWSGYIRHTMTVAGDTIRDAEARAMAHSGLALAMHPLVSKETEALTMEEGNDPGFRVRMVSEGGKLNLNFLFAGEDPRKLEIFRRWLEMRGIDSQARDRMIDCVLDWLDADNVKRVNGQEDGPGYHPPNRGQFLSVEELAEVAGTEPLTSQPGWKDDLTVYSQGSIDISSADAHILRLLPDLGDVAIDRFLQWRRGGDGIDGTLDDPVIQKLETVQGFLGLNKTQFQQLGGLIMLRDNTWQIISEGWSGKVVRQVTVVVRKGSQNPQILNWKE